MSLQVLVLWVQAPAGVSGQLSVAHPLCDEGTHPEHGLVPSVPNGGDSGALSLPQMLRLRADEIETSRGLTVGPSLIMLLRDAAEAIEKSDPVVRAGSEPSGAK